MKKRNKAQFKLVVCIYNEEDETDLHVLKIYRQISDRDAEQDGMIRVIDESGEDYLYPADYFLPLDLPKSTEKVLEQASELQTA